VSCAAVMNVSFGTYVIQRISLFVKHLMKAFVKVCSKRSKTCSVTDSSTCN
jgi:hypothetical protein